MKLSLATSLAVGICTFSALACRTAEPGSLLRETTSLPAPSHPPPRLPAPGEPVQAWGGDDPLKWRTEAVVANAISRGLNDAWAEPGVSDAMVAIPGRFEDSLYKPYGDGQSNARMIFGDWHEPRPPLVATLSAKADGSLKIRLRFDGGLALAQSKIELNYEENGGRQFTTIVAAKDAGGDLVADWNSVPLAARTAVTFARPSPGFDDWFALSFRYSVKSIDAMTAAIPEEKRHFNDGPGAFGRPVVDPEGMRQASVAQPTPFDNMEAHEFSAHYNVEQQGKPYLVPNVHGRYGGEDGPVTAVGRGITWVANAPGAPFKILYTCFEARRKEDEAAAGVVSGGGWHRIGDKSAKNDADPGKRDNLYASETIFNSVEMAPIIVVGGFADVSGRAGLSPPSDGLAYGLKDAAVARWLWPGEAFITVATTGPKNYHWFFFDFDREVCTEEWVYPCAAPTSDEELKCSG